MIQAVLFDFDHTLYDREKTIRAAAPELYEQLRQFIRADVTKAQFSDALLSAEKSDAYYDNGYRGVLDELQQQDIFTVKPTLEQYLEHFYPTMSKNIVVFDDTYAVLQTLKDHGYKVALLTNGKVKYQQEKLKYTRVPEYMDEIIICEQLGFQKPDPRTFLTMCQRLGVSADRAVYVGDNMVCDIGGAAGAGLKTIWLPFAREWPAHLTPPDYTIASLSEIPDILA